MMYSKNAVMITPSQAAKILQPLPKSWKGAAGLLRRHKRRLRLHIKKVRQEFESIAR